MWTPFSFVLLTSTTLFSIVAATLVAESPSTPTSSLSGQAEASLEQAARTILEKNCMSCHGDLQMSDFDMRTKETLLKGGKRGPAVIPGKAEESRLFMAAAHIGEPKMPPKKPPLPPEDVETLRRWINEGVPWTATVAAHEQKPEPSWWSLRKPRRPQIPKVKNESWVRNPIDAFILAKLEEKRLTVAPRADKRTLIRRAYFDLIGLPPIPEEVETFLKDSSPDAYEKLIDRLLASSHYGERWARHWLDVVRYADSAGYETDFYFPYAWRYRDYVIKSFNEDKPYDRFVQEQIAGDELWPDNLEYDNGFAIALEKLEHLEARIGTGLYTIGPWVAESQLYPKKLMYERLTDQADTTGSAFLGLTFGCARCHDHKFDPITQRDYYRLQGIFAGSQPVQIPVVGTVSTSHREDWHPKLIALADLKLSYRRFEKKVTERIIEAKKKEFSREVVEAYEIPEEKRTPNQQKLAEPLIEAVGTMKLKENFEKYLTAEEQKEQKNLLDRLGKELADLPDAEISHGVRFEGLFDNPTASVLGHREPELVPEVHILERGELEREKGKVSPGLPAVLSDGAMDFEQSMSGAFVPRTRKMLALWLSRPDHPLTGRVMVNRIWHWHFGRGIVGTPNDFGQQGQPPTHPELLDWLATEFVARGWSLKSMHRLVMLSNTYQMSSQHFHENNVRVDPDNHYLWRMNRRRLEAEALWDAILSVAGTFNPKMWGDPVCPPLTEEELASLKQKWHWPVPSDPAEQNRRAIYILARRRFTFPMLAVFDNADTAASCPERVMTTVPPQALWFLNNKTMFRRAQQMAERLVAEGGDSPSAWVQRAWRLALNRTPSQTEEREALELISSLSKKGSSGDASLEVSSRLAQLGPGRATALAGFCLAIFNLNEFLYVD